MTLEAFVSFFLKLITQCRRTILKFANITSHTENEVNQNCMVHKNYPVTKCTSYHKMEFKQNLTYLGGNSITDFLLHWRVERNKFITVDVSLFNIEGQKYMCDIDLFCQTTKLCPEHICLTSTSIAILPKLYFRSQSPRAIC